MFPDDWSSSQVLHTVRRAHAAALDTGTVRPMPDGRTRHWVGEADGVRVEGLVRDGRHVLSNVVATQFALHEKFRGVVPEIASRAHIENLLPTLHESVAQAGVRLEDVDAVSVTHRPGLIGSLLIGLTAAKTLAWTLGKPLIGRIENGAQPIDQMVFRDDDGQVYMFYGGWKHANVVKLAPDLLGVVPFPDGTTYKDITPDPAYVEGPFMAKRKGVYYFMWSEGGWTGPDYRVAYAMGTSPFGPFKRIGTILAQDGRIARGAGHHSIVNVPGTDEWYIAYHRRPLGDDEGNHREMAVERLYFNDDGTIRPVVMTNEGVAPRPVVPGRRQASSFPQFNF